MFLQIDFIIIKCWDKIYNKLLGFYYNSRKNKLVRNKIPKNKVRYAIKNSEYQNDSKSM
mgnify:CR=1 FL=1